MGNGLLETLICLKDDIESMGGIANITIAIEDEETYNKIKEKLSGIFTDSNIPGQIEGLNGIKIWNEGV